MKYKIFISFFCRKHGRNTFHSDESLAIYGLGASRKACTFTYEVSITFFQF
jgi:hypothetical protein